MPICADEQVVGLEITVHDAVGVEVVEALHDVPEGVKGGVGLGGGGLGWVDGGWIDKWALQRTRFLLDVLMLPCRMLVGRR